MPVESSLLRGSLVKRVSSIDGFPAFLEGLNQTSDPWPCFRGGCERPTDKAKRYEREGYVEAFLFVCHHSAMPSPVNTMLPASYSRDEQYIRQMTQIQNPEEHGGHFHPRGRHWKRADGIVVSIAVSKPEK